jgi:hypothetical protein
MLVCVMRPFFALPGQTSVRWRTTAPRRHIEHDFFDTSFSVINSTGIGVKRGSTSCGWVGMHFSGRM